jgi:hypothetical protein
VTATVKDLPPWSAVRGQRQVRYSPPEPGLIIHNVVPQARSEIPLCKALDNPVKSVLVVSAIHLWHGYLYEEDPAYR